MPPTERKVAGPGTPIPGKKPRSSATVPKRKASARSALSSARCPRDSHQDDLIVNSIETNSPNSKRRCGAKHYEHMLSLEKSYEHVCMHPETETPELSLDDLGTPDAVDAFVRDGRLQEEQELLRGGTLDPNIDYTTLPSPPASKLEYTPQIYLAFTYNPAVLLAIVRIAERNMPFLNLDSAIQHLPHLALDEAVPRLRPGVFVEDTPCHGTADDEATMIACLPNFYSDGRHALGYFSLRYDSERSYAFLSTAVFTPCTDPDLVTWKMIGGDHDQQCVGARRGQCLDPSVAEDYEEWCRVFKVVNQLWKQRMEYTMGKAEDGLRWKTYRRS